MGFSLSKAWKSVTKTVNDIVGDKVYDAVGGSAALVLNPGQALTVDAVRNAASKLTPDMPEAPQQEDPSVAAQRAQDDAQGIANKRMTSRRRAIRSQSLLATGAQGLTSQAPTASLLAQGKASLGA